MRRLGYRYERTIARTAEVKGVGFLTGATVRLRFRPAPPQTGIAFVRSDRQPALRVPALANRVTGTQRRTVLGDPPGQIGLVEHVLAALAGLRIDNCLIELNAPEPPGMDGSARHFVRALYQAGIVLQPSRRGVWAVNHPVVVARNGATLSLYPPENDEFKVSYLLDYGLGSPIGRQQRTQIITPNRFAGDLADSRTFVLESEAAELRRQGLGSRTTAADLLIFGPQGPIGNRLRHADEPARHKILDLLGDLALFGHDLRGCLVAYRSGHDLNVELARTLTRMLEGSCASQRTAA